MLKPWGQSPLGAGLEVLLLLGCPQAARGRRQPLGWCPSSSSTPKPWPCCPSGGFCGVWVQQGAPKVSGLRQSDPELPGKEPGSVKIAPKFPFFSLLLGVPFLCASCLHLLLAGSRVLGHLLLFLVQNRPASVFTCF